MLPTNNAANPRAGMRIRILVAYEKFVDSIAHGVMRVTLVDPVADEEGCLGEARTPPKEAAVIAAAIRGFELVS